MEQRRRHKSPYMDQLKKRAWLSWISVGILAVLCGVLALLQNHWITEVSLAERERLQQQLQTELSHLSREFNNEITNACASLLPGEQEIDALGREKAYSLRYVQWKQSHGRIFSRIALATIGSSGERLKILNPATAEFSSAEWPSDWSPSPGNLISLPQRDFRAPFIPDRDREEAGERLILELNLDYVRGVLLPDLLQRYLASAGKLDYQAEVVDSGDPSKVIFQSATTHGRIGDSADASIPLFDVNYNSILRPRGQPPPHPFHEGPPPEGPPPHEMHPPFQKGLGHGPPPFGPGGPSRWRLLVRHQAGSLEAVVSRARIQNLATSLGVLLLIVATVGTLLRFSRRAQQLAEVQMNFVAGVSHELRTPLTVIRTAAFNLRGKLANRPEQIERYGKLIQDESEKLGALVEQVLRFAGTRAGHVIREREAVTVETLIEEGLRSSVALDAFDLVIEKHIEPGLPLVLADELAMKFALQNLVDNALKYGTGEKSWIGISASRSADRNGSMIEIRVADKGPGIPPEEQQHIFDPFFRGRRAVRDQVHGTGLGLSLVRKIVEAHGGTISVKSDAPAGAEFIVRIPAAPLELQHEFAHPVG